MNKITAELIKELVGLAVEKGLDFDHFAGFKTLDIDGCSLIHLSHEDAPEQLQTAIDKVKSL